jgi:hypothetical protein
MNLRDAVDAAKAGQSRAIRCPAHDDHSPSLSVRPGRDGAVLLRCFKGCDSKAVLAAAGMTWADFFPRPSVRPARGLTIPQHRKIPTPPTSMPAQAARRAQWPRFQEPTDADLSRIAELRSLGLPCLRLAANRGVLWISTCWGYRCWIVTDHSRQVAQARRLDGGKFEMVDGAPKAMTLPGSSVGWPVGLETLPDTSNSILFCEGGPDLLAAYQFIHTEGREANAGAVAMLGATARICEDALPRFAGRSVRIFEHDDPAGRKAGHTWARQLRSHAARIDRVTFDGLHRTDGTPVKDLNDLALIDADDFEANRWILRIVP